MGFASDTDVGSAEAVWIFGEVACALPEDVTTAVLARSGVAEAEEMAKDCDLRIAPRSLGCSPDARVKLWDDGTTVLGRLEGSAGEEACCGGTRKPTSAIKATAVEAAIPAASSPAENGLSVEVAFMMLWVKISKLMQLVQPAEPRTRAADSSLAHCRAWR